MKAKGKKREEEEEEGEAMSKKVWMLDFGMNFVWNFGFLYGFYEIWHGSLGLYDD